MVNLFEMAAKDCKVVKKEEDNKDKKYGWKRGEKKEATPPEQKETQKNANPNQHTMYVVKYFVLNVLQCISFVFVFMLFFYLLK